MGPNISGQTGINVQNLHMLPKYNDKLINLRLWNARSVRHKTVHIIENIVENDVDVFIITETWLAENDSVVIGEMLPQGYSCLNFPRKGDEHGGIGIIYKSNLNIKSTPTGIDTPSFEHACVVMKKAGIRLIPVYRPPPSETNCFKVSQFLDEFDAFLNEISMAPIKTILIGDFNIHVDVPSKADSVRFLGRSPKIISINTLINLLIKLDTP
jgi:exonuclease III